MAVHSTLWPLAEGESWQSTVALVLVCRKTLGICCQLATLVPWHESIKGCQEEGATLAADGGIRGSKPVGMAACEGNEKLEVRNSVQKFSCHRQGRNSWCDFTDRLFDGSLRKNKLKIQPETECG